jgi:hypothetical protein
VTEAPIASVTGASVADIETFFAACVSYKFSA